MNKYICLIIVLFWSCKQSSNKQDDITVTIGEEGITIKKDSSEVNVDDNDCTFDQETQTDDFLKGIKELEGYSWNQETKTAIIKLSETEILSIYRGGCAHFELSGSFNLKNVNLSYPRDKKIIYKKALWLAERLTGFPYKIIKKDILNENFEIYNDHNSVSLEFLSEKNFPLYIWVSDNNEYSEIALIFTIN